LLTAVGVVAAGCRPNLAFVQVARESQGGLLHIRDVRPAINNGGTVVFSALDTNGTEVLLAGTNGPLTTVGLGSAGINAVDSLAVDDAGDVAVTAARTGTPDFRGVYTGTTSGGTLATGYEGPFDHSDPTDLPPSIYGLAGSPNGTLTFSTIDNGQGAILRGPVAGPYASVRDGSGTFFNTKHLAVNDGGRVAAAMEYGDPTKGLSRGILLFDTPNPALDDIDTAIEKLGIGTQPDPSINAAGDVAFALNSTATLTFFDPPDVADQNHIVAQLTLVPGVYVGHPKPFGAPSNLTLIADTTGSFTSFGTVLINDSGRVVFEADLSGGGHGIFFGPDAFANRIVEEKDNVLGPKPFLSVKLGGLNNAGQVAFSAVDFSTVHGEVWTVSGF
jgi:hypothetical protein